MNFISRLQRLVGDTPQKDIAARTGISASAISQYLNEEAPRTPKADELYKLAKLFGVSMEYLLVGEGEEPAAGGITLHDREEVKMQEMGFKCAEHIQRWLAQRKHEPEWHGWALVELRTHFPLDRPGPENKVSSRKVDLLERIVEERIEAARSEPGKGSKHTEPEQKGREPKQPAGPG